MSKFIFECFIEDEKEHPINKTHSYPYYYEMTINRENVLDGTIDYKNKWVYSELLDERLEFYSYECYGDDVSILYIFNLTDKMYAAPYVRRNYWGQKGVKKQLIKEILLPQNAE